MSVGLWKGKREDCGEMVKGGVQRKHSTEFAILEAKIFYVELEWGEGSLPLLRSTY